MGRRRRTITVTLTEPQYRALSGAVALREAEIEADEPGSHAEARALRRGWNAIRDAWTDPYRGRR
ncbi:hypothetical protein QC999_gp87 [Microbacterium phage Cressida]|uniref:Uncharacterized protein n=1 Tax=Microbacterium phage Cressida TaxID=2591216 RepID=A0A514DI33_9CAUD|nr:hypothetical protein QC999_gp87 [Microbacterium phage Cressida]QDH93263.1 hypothetical protein PBI_CRESSIDA_21 [Microbacterium phage Cressida]